MVKQNEWVEIEKLHEDGLSFAQIVRKTGRSFLTIKKLILNGGPKKNPIDDSDKKVAPFKKYLAARIKQGATNRKVLFFEIKKQGYNGSYSTLNNFCNTEFAVSQKCKIQRRSRHIETPPGEQAQVDWGSFGKIEIGGREERLYCFVFVLGYSRATYIHFTIKQNLKTLEQCHIQAFEKIGIPKTIVYDNMKTVVLSREKLPDNKIIPHCNPAFLDFAQFYGFKIALCPPYWPRAKGKVESGVKYVRNNFMKGMRFQRDFKSLEELNGKAQVWLDTVANVRIHGTTEKRPVDLWKKEKAHLVFPIGRVYPVSSFLTRHSTKDGLVEFKSNFYSVPMDYALKKLHIQEMVESGILSINIYYQDEIIAIHPVSHDRGKWIIDQKHIAVISKSKGVGNKGQSRKPRLPKPIIYARGLDYYKSLMQR